MGLMDSVLNGLGDQAAAGLGDLLQSQGGVEGLAERFGGAGLADTVQSWIGTGANANISPEQIAQVLGSGPSPTSPRVWASRRSRRRRPWRASFPKPLID